MSFRKLKKKLNKITEGLAAAMLAALFFTFVIQVYSRYVMEESFGWTVEFCLTLWVWLVFFGDAANLRHDHHVIFDVVYHKVNKRIRTVFALIGSFAVCVGFALSFFPTWDYLLFFIDLEKKSPLIKIPMQYVFGVYIIFLVSVITRYALRFFGILKNGLPEEHVEEKLEGDLH